LTILNDLGLVLTGKPAGSQVEPATGMDTGTAKNTWGLPVQFTKDAVVFDKAGLNFNPSCVVQCGSICTWH